MIAEFPGIKIEIKAHAWERWREYTGEQDFPPELVYRSLLLPLYTVTVKRHALGIPVRSKLRPDLKLWAVCVPEDGIWVVVTVIKKRETPA